MKALWKTLRAANNELKIFGEQREEKAEVSPAPEKIPTLERLA
jgi:hypothetical protein